MKHCNKIILFSVILAMTAGFVFSKKLATLSELSLPESITFDSERMYVTEKTNVYIYSRDNYKLLKKFGKKGEGPKEFRGVIQVHPRSDDLMIFSFGKVSFFSKSGEYKGEVKVSSTSWFFRPYGDDKFVGFLRQVDRDSGIIYNAVGLFDSQLKSKLVYSRQKKQVQRVGGSIDVISHPVSVFYIVGDKVVINEKDDHIRIYDANSGKNVLAFEPKVDRVEVTDEVRKSYHEFYRTNPNTRDGYHRLKDRMVFPEYFPAVWLLYADNQYLYVVSYKSKVDKFQLFVYDMKGNLIKNTWLKIFMVNVHQTYPNGLYNGSYFQIVENEETEDWELMETPIIDN